MKIYTRTLPPICNYAKVDKYLSRSAQPSLFGIVWLRDDRVSDVINFRTMGAPQIDYDEAKVVENLGMRYHNIPTVTAKPREDGVLAFLELMETIKGKNGKAHIHCKAGADRTGLYTFIYKSMHKIGKMEENVQEWLKFGHDAELFPNLIPWAKKFVHKYRKLI